MFTSVDVDDRNLQIGRFTYFGQDTQLLTWLPGERIRIGSYCSIANRVTICTGGRHRTDVVSTYPFDVYLLNRPQSMNRSYQRTRDTVIGNDVWIGCGATILGGVEVGSGAVIATGSVVFSDIPAYGIAAGNPAQVVRFRFSKPVVERLLRIAWWDWPSEKIRENVEWFYQPIHEFIARFDTNQKT